MTYRIIWEPEALTKAERFAKDDPDGVRQVFSSTDKLANNPRPTGTFGSADLRRVHVGIYRLLHEIHDGEIRINVIHLGRA